MSNDRRQSGLWSRNPETGFYEQAPIPGAQIQPKGPYAYYEPPPRQPNQAQPQRFSFSERALKANGDDPLIPSTNGVLRSGSKKEHGNAVAQDVEQTTAHPTRELLDHHPETTSDQLATTKHINSTSMPGSAQHKALSIDPDYVPSNIRTQAWSPDVLSPRQKPRQTSNATSSSIPDSSRKGSVPGQSPLQSLESWSKEEKRARVERAEHKARQRSVTTNKGDDDVRRSATLRSERGRVVSDGVARRSSQPERRSDKRQVSGPASPTATAAVERFQNASHALRENGRRHVSSPRQSDARSAPDNVQEPEASPRSPRARGVEDKQESSQRHEPANLVTSNEISRSQSGKYKHRARDAGFAGAAAAYTAGRPLSQGEPAERGKAAYERRKASISNEQSPERPISRDIEAAGPGTRRSGSKKLQKRSPVSGDPTSPNQRGFNRTGLGDWDRDVPTATTDHESDPIPPNQVQNPEGTGVKYSIPPQTAAAKQANQQVGFHLDADQQEKHHRLGNLFHHREHRVYTPSAKPLEDWRQAKTARLTLKDLDYKQAVAAPAKDDTAWWENSKRSRSSRASGALKLPQEDEPYEEQSQKFEPFLFLKCGPLLRYTGIRKEAGQNNPSALIEVWRGSIMIVTEDDQSDLSRTPVLRLFAQPMDLVEPPPPHLAHSGQELPPEFEDPVAGQVKLSRTGRPLYVRPVHDIDGEIDLSRQENNDGLFSATRTPVLGPQAITGPDGHQTQHITFQDKSRVKKWDGERAGRFRDVKAARLHTERGFTFWRFNIEVELGKVQARVAYRINNGPAIGFWVPAKGETMNILFHSCNGFSMSVDSNKFSGPDPLWRDALNRHQSQPFHVMIGGGDQVYNDAAMRDTVHFQEWLSSKNPEHKRGADFTPQMQEELENFYLNRYAMWFSQGLFAMANSQIPMVNIWDDHDIIDGFGSYPHHFMSTRVFTGLGAVAFKYYMLFQHQSLSTETEKEEPSWLLGKSPGPYIHERSRSIYMSLGNKVAFLGLDCRTERMRDEILSAETYHNIFDRCQDEIVKGETKHLIVLLGVPIAYPRLNFLENVLTSRAMTPIKALGRTGMLGGFVNKFDGGVEILDDLDDHWTAKHHKGERNWFIEELQLLAAEKSVRVTILGGDVHLGAIGQFYSPKKLGIPKDRDYRYMPNVISSAIVNTPPPTAMADVLNRRNKVHHLDVETDEDMIPMFSHDVDGSKRNNNHLMPRRNFCIIRDYVPGSTPPTTPIREEIEPGTPLSGTFGGGQDDRMPRDRRFPPGSMKRTLSLTRGPANLVRRLSGSRSRKPPVSLAPEHTRPYNEEDKGLPLRSNSVSAGGQSQSAQPGENGERPVYTFHRRPTNMSEKEARKAAAAIGDNHDGREPGHVNLEGGLDISLCVEVDQRDPSGTTVPYRLLVPALWYEDTGDANATKFQSHRVSFMDRLRWNRKRETPRSGQYYDDWNDSDRTRTPSPSRTSQDEVTEENTAANALGLTSTGRGAYGRAGPYSAPGQTGTGFQDATPRLPRGNVSGQNKSIPIAGPYQPSQKLEHASGRDDRFSSPPQDITNIRPQQAPTMQSQYQMQSVNSNRPQPVDHGRPNASNSARSRAPPPPSAAPAGPARPSNAGYDGNDIEGSLTPSDEYLDEEEYLERRGARAHARRSSKAERFFGIGDATRDVASGGRRSMQTERLPSQQQQPLRDGVRYSTDAGRPGAAELSRGGSMRRGGGWKIWKKG